jgi:hypothetical protein
MGQKTFGKDNIISNQLLKKSEVKESEACYIFFTPFVVCISNILEAECYCNWRLKEREFIMHVGVMCRSILLEGLWSDFSCTH